MLTINQIRWAASHDWFVAATKNADGQDGVIVAEEAVWSGPVTDEDCRIIDRTNDGRAVTKKEFRFFDVAELRDWAGY